jgi:hypothetical protein
MWLAMEAAQQPPGAGRRSPVYAPGGVAPLVIAHAPHAGGVFEQGGAGGQRYLGRARRQAQLLERDHLGVDDDVLRRYLHLDAIRDSQ